MQKEEVVIGDKVKLRWAADTTEGRIQYIGPNLITVMWTIEGYSTPINYELAEFYTYCDIIKEQRSDWEEDFAFA